MKGDEKAHAASVGVKSVFWTGKAPERCDVCERRISDVFVDGRTRLGPWANMCPACDRTESVGEGRRYGTGIGQKYTKQADGRWLKTAG